MTAPASPFDPFRLPKLSLKTRAIAVGAAMTAFLLWMGVDHAIARASGTEVILEARPIDPRSLFRGYYVIIDTPIHDLDAGKLAGADTFEAGDKIFVFLSEQDDGTWAPVSLAARAPQARAASAASSNAVAIEGRVTRVRPALAQTGGDDAVGPFIEARYNIESFFAEHAAAQELENAVRANELQVIVSVTGSGRAILKGLVRDGEKIYDRML